MSVEPFWIEINEPALRQGDYLPCCLVPTFGPDLAPGHAHEIAADEYDLILITQSCDLEQRKVRLIAACPILLDSALRGGEPSLRQKGPLE